MCQTLLVASGGGHAIAWLRVKKIIDLHRTTIKRNEKQNKTYIKYKLQATLDYGSFYRSPAAAAKVTPS